jgi:5-methylcytosine-specific restriction enzyme A
MLIFLCMNLIMPKQDGRLSVVLKTLEVYLENELVDNEVFKREIRKKILDISKPSAELTDGPGLLKKSEIARYFGLVQYSFKNKVGTITKYGKDFLNGEKEKRIDIIFNRMNNISFGRNNSAVKSSNSYLNPPILFLKALKELESLKRSEFSYLLYAIQDENKKYNDVINDVISLSYGAPSHPNQNKYNDTKFTVFFEEIGITYELDKRFYLNPKYLGRIDSLKIFSNDVKEFNNVLGENSIINNKTFIDASNNRNPKLIEVKSGRSIYKTDPKLKNRVFMDKNYQCEIDPSHKTFVNKNEIIYMEGHHLIPMKAQKDFTDVNIDRIENIICLCPNCHRMIHHANTDIKRKLIYKLASERLNSLKDVGINITPEELLERYYN